MRASTAEKTFYDSDLGVPVIASFFTLVIIRGKPVHNQQDKLTAVHNTEIVTEPDQKSKLGIHGQKNKYP